MLLDHQHELDLKLLQKKRKAKELKAQVSILYIFVN